MTRRRRRDEAPQGSPAWMSTYSDLVTLLLTFFVFLFSLSSIDSAKFNAFLSSVTQNGNSFSILSTGGSENVILDMMGNGIIEFPIPPSDRQQHDDDFSLEVKPETVAQLEEIRARQSKAELSVIADDLRTYFAENVHTEGESVDPDTDVVIQQSDYYINISMQGGVTFQSGTHALTPEALVNLNEIAGVLVNYPNNEIEVSGYTDTRPINTPMYPDNYVLSARRAIEVTQYLISAGMKPSMMRPVAMGETHPVADNGTEEGRLRNRRVEIKIYSQVYTGTAQPTTDEEN